MGIITERFVEERWTPPWVRYEHMTRYDWAAAYCRGMTVVDIATGSGFGAALVARAGAAAVYGFDAAGEAIAYARARYAHPVLTFNEADALALPIPDSSIDVVVSFETIEHLAGDDKFVDEVARVLRPDGRFLVSTPNRRLLDPGTGLADRPQNAFHVREYMFSEFDDLLARRFSAREWFGQSDFSRSYVRALNGIGRIWPFAAVQVHRIRKLAQLPWETPARHRPMPIGCMREPEVFLAICRR